MIWCLEIPKEMSSELSFSGTKANNSKPKGKHKVKCYNGVVCRSPKSCAYIDSSHVVLPKLDQNLGQKITG